MSNCSHLLFDLLFKGVLHELKHSNKLSLLINYSNDIITHKIIYPPVSFFVLISYYCKSSIKILEGLY